MPVLRNLFLLFGLTLFFPLTVDISHAGAIGTVALLQGEWVSNSEPDSLLVIKAQKIAWVYGKEKPEFEKFTIYNSCPMRDAKARPDKNGDNLVVGEDSCYTVSKKDENNLTLEYLGARLNITSYHRKNTTANIDYIKDDNGIQSLCSTEEMVVFNCGRKSKILSLCSDNRGSFLKYRFGKTNKVDLEFPKDRQDPTSAGFKFTDPANQEAQISFSPDKTVTYQVFAGYAKSRNNQAGVRVELPKKTLTLNCTTQYSSIIFDAFGHLF